MYLALVWPHLGYATQVWAPRTKDLIRQVERIQRRANNFILRLPFVCEQSYQDRLIQLNLLSLTYWHEFLELVYFIKVVNGIVNVNQVVIPQARTARASPQYKIVKCKTVTFQKSFFNRSTRI